MSQPRLRKTTVEMEGRFEERWVLVEDDPELWEEDADLAVVGKPATRRTGPKRVSGAARFVVDIVLPGMLVGAVLRSPHAHATVELDLEAARAVHGVRAVLGPDGRPHQGRRSILASEAEYAGQPVAALAADDDAAAEAGLAALAPQWTELAFEVDLDAALRDQRFVSDPSEYERGDLEAGLAAAAAIVEAEYRTPAQIHHALEPNAAVAHWVGDDLAVWVSTQGIFDARAELARAYDLPLDRVHVTCEFMGGGFGAKQGATQEGLLAAELASASGRPVRLVNDRRAQGISTGARGPTIQTYRIGATADGELTGIEVSAVIGAGVRGWAFPVTNPATSLYRCENVSASTFPVKLNLGFTNAFRAPGVMEGCFGFESALDELAAELGIDPIELRLRNSVDVDQVSGERYSSRRLDDCFRRARELAGWESRADLARANGDGLRRGMGVAGQIWWGSGGPPAHVVIRLGSEGIATVVSGSQDIGTGVTTTFAQVAAEAIGLPLDQVRVELGSTRHGLYAPVSGGSMTTPAVAPAVQAAGHDVRDKLLSLAGDLFEVSPGDLTLRGGEFASADGALREPLSAVTDKLDKSQIVGTGSRGPNTEGVRVQTFGCQIATVAVDVATGEIRVERIVAVHDVGRIINPLGASSQAEGGILQALGFALSEERVVDPTTGTVVNPGLDDYKVMTMADTPEIVIDFIDRADTLASSVGAKGLGEPPIVPTAAAVANAVAHATGVRMREAPLTRKRFLEAAGS